MNMYFNVAKAYDDFAGFLFTETTAAGDKAVFHQTLCHTRVEFSGLYSRQASVLKKTPIVQYLKKAIALVNTQMEFVKRQMQTEKCGQCAGFPKPERKIKWTGGIVDLAELVYALHEAGCFNQGDIYLKDLFAEIGEVSGIKIKNFPL
ncbi:MAG: RteC domain-containing protein [Prevotella sp.]|nr:RteC domain-containing protein [Prevotella sp.]